MTQTASKWLQAASVLSLALAMTTSGCKSSGTSRWAWNPWSKRPADVTAVADTTAPKLPTVDATPQIEGLSKPAAATSAPSAATLAQGATPPAVSGIAPTFEAFADAVPSANKLAAKPAEASAPAWQPYPTSPSASPAAATPPAAATVAAAGGPYDPNGYKPSAPATPSQPTSDRYGLGNRYASTSTASNDANPFADLPPVQDAATAIGDRYAAATAAASPPLADATEPMQQTANQAGQSLVAKTDQAAGQLGSRYGSTVAQASNTFNPAQAMAAPAPAASAYPSTGSVAATPATPGYPVASATPKSSPAPTNTSPLVGTLPPATSVYASTATPNATPITPIEPASANETPNEKSSVVRLTTLPGEYRPGGTSTYPSTGGAKTSAPTSRY